MELKMTGKLLRPCARPLNICQISILSLIYQKKFNKNNEIVFKYLKKVTELATV